MASPLPRPHTAALCGALLLALVPQATAQEDAEVARLAESVAELRQEVAAAERALQTEREREAAEAAALAAELASLQMQAERAEARDQMLHEVIASRRLELESSRQRERRLIAPTLRALEATAEAIKTSSPLHRQPRLARVLRARDRLAADALSAPDALQELGAILEDELELASTTQLARHVVEVDGAPRLVPAVALGTAALYWEQERGGRAGWIAWEGGSWRTHEATDPATREAIASLHEARRSNSQAPILALPLPPAIEAPAPRPGGAAAVQE